LETPFSDLSLTCDRMTGSELEISAWESVASGLPCRLTCGENCLPVTVQHPRRPVIMAR
jgi:hypothetical protein